MTRTLLQSDRDPGDLGGPVLTLLTGSGIAFLVGYAAKLLLLRLYDPASFGLYEFVIAIVSVLMSVGSLRYDDAIVLPEDDRHARDVLGLAVLVTGVVGLLTVVVLPLSAHIARMADEPDLTALLWTVPLLFLAVRLSRLAEQWMTRRERFGRMAGANVARALASNGAWIGLGLRSAGGSGLLAGFGLGHLVSAAVNAWSAAGDLRRIPGRLTLRGLRRTATRYRRFPLFSAPATLVAALATRAPFILLLFYFDREVLGRFGQAFGIVYVPLGLLAAAIGQVFFVRAAAAHRSGGLDALASSVHDQLVHLAFLPVAAVAVAGPDVFEVLFGTVWRDAGAYAGWIGAWILFTTVASPLTRLFDVLEKQRADLVVNAVMLAVMTAAIVAGGSTGSVTVTLACIGSAGALVRLAQITVALRLAGLSSALVARPYLRHGRVVLPAMVLLAVSRSIGLPHVTTIAFLLILAVFGVTVVRREGLMNTKGPDPYEPGPRAGDEI